MTEQSNQDEETDKRALIPPGDQTEVGRVATGDRLLTKKEFQGLADLPPEAEWFANIRNKNTKRAYGHDVAEFARFVGVGQPEDFRLVTRAHIIAWRTQLEERDLAASTVRRKLSALSSLFDQLCEANAVTDNPVHGVKRPSEGANEGKTPALGNGQARRLLEAPDEGTLKGKRDRAILATLFYHGLRCDELCRLKASDRQTRQGVPHLRIHGKGDKIRFIPISAHAIRLIDDYLIADGRIEDRTGALFRPVRNNATGVLKKTAASLVALGAHSPLWRGLRRRCRIGLRAPSPYTESDRRHQCPRARSRHRQGAGMARSCEYCDHQAL